MPRQWINKIAMRGEQLTRFLVPHTAVESTTGLAAIQVEGAAARDVLANGYGLDLRSPYFALGTCTRTRLAQLPIILDYVDVKPRFELYVGRSYLSHLCSWLCDAAVGFEGSRRL
jgi:heterotetrameric sarcosine oxidase gamma subunit